MENRRVVLYAGRTRLVEGLSPGGRRYAVWEDIVPRLRGELADCVAYLYPSALSAEQGVQAGGTGFLVGVRSEARPAIAYCYVVTNRHVVRGDPKDGTGKAPVVRLNTHDGGTDIITDAQWKDAPAGDDIAIASISFEPTYKFRPVLLERFMTQKLMKELAIGWGDDLFLVGRFISHAGKQRNMPVARFGAIAMMPDEPIENEETKFQQESFLAELHTIGGFSGSPVFISLPKERYIEHPQYNSEEERKQSHRSWLLGIEWCNASFLERNTGMSGVIPAWKIADVILNDEDFKMQRKRADEQEKAQIKKSGIKLTRATGMSQKTRAPEREDRIDIPIPTRKQFETDLGKAIRKRKP